MKLLKRWLAFFVVVVLLIGVAFNSRGPLIASQVDGTTEGTADPAASEDGQQVSDGQDQQQSEDSQNIEGTEPKTEEGAGQDTPEPALETDDSEKAEENTEETVHQDAMELKQDMTDENGNVICTVTANIQEGTFEANTADVTMEVGYVAADVTDQIKALMEKAVADDKMLGEYFLYNVIFKVNGEQVEPGKEVQITFEPKDFKIKDTKKATVFYYNEANSPAGNAEEEIVGITQKADKIKELQDAGQSIDTVDDDYDLSEISLREDGTAEKVMMEGLRSTVYGCYLAEKKPEEPKAEEPKKEENKTDDKKTEQVLKYEDDDVKVQVSADKDGIIPEGATLQVVPIKKDAEETQDQYKEVEQKIQEKASEEEYEIAGFLAYDITFIDKDGNKVEPNGEVKVSMEYKKAAMPEEVDEEKAKDAEVTVLHLEEDEKGEVKEVVDMVADESQEAIVETIDESKIKKAEFKTDSFSTFTITWTYYYNYYKAKITVHYVDEDGNEIDQDKNNISFSGKTVIDLGQYEQNISGYTYKNLITVDSIGGNQITKLRATEYSENRKTVYWIEYSNDGKTWTKWMKLEKTDSMYGNGNIYFIYSDDNQSGGGTTERTLTKDKKATVADEEKRIFDINLTAAATGREEGVEAKGASIVLVLDASGSMEDSDDGKHLSDIKTAAKSFAATAANKSPISEIAVVWYQGSQTLGTKWNGDRNSDCTTSTSNPLFKKLDTSSNVTAINNFIDNKTANGGTPMGDALFKANQILKEAKYQEEKYVLFFTDGLPGHQDGNDNWNCGVANDAFDYAKEIKKSGAKIYTIGYKNAYDTFKWNEDHSSSTESDRGHSTKHTSQNATTFLRDYIASPATESDRYAYDVEDAENLNSIFEEIAGHIGALYEVQPKNITDVIDSRFKLTDESKKALEEKYGNDIQITENQDGTTTITWTGESARIKNKTNGGWEASFQVQAKDDFIGGNVVATNGSASGINVSDNDFVPFPQPSVNVKLLNPEIGDKEITVYKGDMIESSKFPGELLDTFSIVELDNETKLTAGISNIPTLTEAEINELNSGKKIIKEYSYPGTEDIVGYFEYSYKPSDQPGGNIEDHSATEVGTKVESYELTIKFVPYTVEERKSAHEEIVPPNNGGTEVTTKDVTGHYYVNVLNRWDIVKRSSSSDTKLLPGAEFELSSAGLVDKKIYYGKSDEDGIVKWYKDKDHTQQVQLSELAELSETESVTYNLIETKAPVGYVLSKESWVVEIKKDGVTIKSAGQELDGDENDNGIYYYFDNTPLYELPSAGGSGIFWYTAGGTLLMCLAGLLALYKNKLKREANISI